VSTNGGGTATVTSATFTQIGTLSIGTPSLVIDSTYHIPAPAISSTDTSTCHWQANVLTLETG
jgi:alanine-alpha-ketoisovalerate/valine-pyruvate aminotransferase